LDGHIWALKADSLTSPLIVTVTVTVICSNVSSRSRQFKQEAKLSLSL